jgi:hypothetical protein
MHKFTRPGTTIASTKLAGFRFAVSDGKEDIEMNTFAILAATLCFTGGLASAATFTGRLMDADCYQTNKVASQENGHKTYGSITKTCAATASTTNFAVRITGSANGGREGSTIKLDESGNTQAASEMQSGALKVARDGRVRVKVSGKLLGETFQTASVSGR